MSSVHKSRAGALGEIDRFAIPGTALEQLQALERITSVNKGAAGLLAAPCCGPCEFERASSCR